MFGKNGLFRKEGSDTRNHRVKATTIDLLKRECLPALRLKAPLGPEDLDGIFGWFDAREVELEEKDDAGQEIDEDRLNILSNAADDFNLEADGIDWEDLNARLSE